MFKRFFIVFVLLSVFILSSTALAQKDEQGAVDVPQAEQGNMVMTGVDFDGDDYTGGMEVVSVEGTDIFIVTGQGAEPYRGIGMQREETFGVAFGGTHCSLGLYELTDDGIAGQWVTTNFEQDIALQDGSITNFEDDVFTFALETEFADGDSEDGAFVMYDQGDAVAVEMSIGGDDYVGTGYVQNDILVVAFGDEDCGLRAYHVNQEAVTVEGVWTMWGYDVVAEESGVIASITGEYFVAGANPDESEYEGALTIDTHNQVHTLRWEIGETVYEGVGILRGNLFAAGFGGEQCGVAHYAVTLNGDLDGMTALPGSEFPGYEYAFREHDNDGIEGDYLIEQGINALGESFVAELRVREWDTEQEVYDLSWTLENGTETAGVGIQYDNMLLAAFGDGCGVSAYDYADDVLVGFWATVGGDALGIEVGER
ncbi:MAG: hypothetical protein SF123_14580 [Chloroflexota bacterium]|nr:hypothetical protein [Chloroflexota bacterium]